MKHRLLATVAAAVAVASSLACAVAAFFSHSEWTNAIGGTMSAASIIAAYIIERSAAKADDAEIKALRDQVYSMAPSVRALSLYLDEEDPCLFGIVMGVSGITVIDLKVDVTFTSRVQQVHLCAIGTPIIATMSAHPVFDECTARVRGGPLMAGCEVLLIVRTTLPSEVATHNLDTDLRTLAPVFLHGIPVLYGMAPSRQN